MKNTLLLLLLPCSLLFTACPPHVRGPENDTRWTNCRAHVDTTKYLCAVGVGEGLSENTALDEADMKAKVQLVKAIQDSIVIGNDASKTTDQSTSGAAIKGNVTGEASYGIPKSPLRIGIEGDASASASGVVIKENSVSKVRASFEEVAEAKLMGIHRLEQEWYPKKQKAYVIMGMPYSMFRLYLKKTIKDEEALKDAMLVVDALQQQ